jgi:hypothetical protein
MEHYTASEKRRLCECPDDVVQSEVYVAVVFAISPKSVSSSYCQWEVGKTYRLSQTTPNPDRL